MADTSIKTFLKRDSKKSNFLKRIAWCNSNRVIVDALMESESLLKQVRELVYKRRKRY
jgi:hypothetical protein